jgi:hypothetical protein
MQLFPNSVLVPDFNAGIIFTNKRVLTEVTCLHLTSPNLAFFKTPGAEGVLRSIIRSRVNYIIQGWKGDNARFSLLAGASGRLEITDGLFVYSGLLTLKFDNWAGTFEQYSDKSWGVNFSVMSKPKNKYSPNQFRLNVGYRNYQAVTRHFGVPVGQFRFALNYHFGI